MGDGGASHLVSPSGPTLFPGSRGVTWGGGGQGDLWVEDKTAGQPGGEADVNREIPGSSCNLLGGAGSCFKLISRQRRCKCKPSQTEIQTSNSKRWSWVRFGQKRWNAPAAPEQNRKLTKSNTEVCSQMGKHFLYHFYHFRPPSVPKKYFWDGVTLRHVKIVASLCAELCA